jgi:hypothetical protein
MSKDVFHDVTAAVRTGCRPDPFHETAVIDRF